MLDLSFSMEGGEVVHRRLDIAVEGLKSFKDPLRKIGSNFMKTFDMNFRSRGSLYGGWAPRKPQYRNGERVDTWPLMEKTGRMRRGFYDDLTDKSLTLGNRTRYFVYHQSRAMPRDQLPRRVMMQIRRQDANMIVKSFQAYLIQILRSRGLR